MRKEFNPVIAYHAKTEKNGWAEVCRYPLNSPEWSEQQRVWIDELLKTGDLVLICGWNMWQIIQAPRIDPCQAEEAAFFRLELQPAAPQIDTTMSLF